MKGALHKRRTFWWVVEIRRKWQKGVFCRLSEISTESKIISQRSKSIGTIIVYQVEGISGNVLLMGKMWKPKIVGHSLGFFEKRDIKCGVGGVYGGDQQN